MRVGQGSWSLVSRVRAAALGALMRSEAGECRSEVHGLRFGGRAAGGGSCFGPVAGCLVGCTSGLPCCFVG